MTPSGIEPATFRFVAQHLNHWATAVPGLSVPVQNSETESEFLMKWVQNCFEVYGYLPLTKLEVEMPATQTDVKLNKIVWMWARL